MKNIMNCKKISEIFLYLTLFSLLISTAVANFAIIFAVTFGLISLISNQESTKYFIKNKISILAISLFFMLFISIFYSVAQLEESLFLLKNTLNFYSYQ